MKNFKRLKSLTLITLCSIMLVGFSGQEKFVELEGYLNGRSSAKFRRQDKNILSVLETGTKGEILESKKMASGNYGLRVKVLSGAKAGQNYWVYYNVNNPDLALYNTAPASWGIERNPATPETAQGTEVTRPTPAIVDNVPLPIERPVRPVTTDTGVETTALGYAPAPGLTSTMNSALQAINNANQTVPRTAPVPMPTICRDCVGAALRPVSIAADSTQGLMKMGEACGTIMNKQGEMGNLGNEMFNIMSEQKYRTLYTRDNSLGPKFCPNFNKLNERQRLQAWVWFWAALGSAESQCDPNVIHRTHKPNGQRLNPTEGIGIWAMERNRAYRLEDQGRDAFACDTVATGKGQARCTIDIMLSTQLVHGHSASSDPESYWGPIKRYGDSDMGKRLKTQMERFDLCYR